MKPILTLEQLSSLTLPQRLAVFVEWLGEQPPGTEYNYQDVTDCAICKFAKSALKLTNPSMGGICLQDSDNYSTPPVQMVPSNSVAMDGYDRALYYCNTLGELYDLLLPLVMPTDGPTTPILTEEERLDLIERRPLVGMGPKVLINGGAECSTPKPIFKSE